MSSWRRAILLSPALVAACATIPDTPVPSNLPNASAGPFRALAAEGEVHGPDGGIVSGSEIGNSRTPPDGFDDLNTWGRDITVVDADGDPSTLGVFAYVAAGVRTNGNLPGPTDPTRSIVRYAALDGRSFDRSAEVVLQADATWEGNVLASPSALRLPSGDILLYYAAAGGIGLARSPDSHAFAKEGPVLTPDPSGWEQGAVPRSPGVVALPDGSFRMFYEVTTRPGVSAIGEATSADGASWTRVGQGPALEKAGIGDGGSEPWDSTSVGTPSAQVSVSADGRPEIRVYYGALDSKGTATIGLAARYGSEGPLTRAASAVFGTGGKLGPREPCTLSFTGFTFLYATQASSTTDSSPVVAVGVAPATVILPAPLPM
jgi:hypothetical protein